MDTQKISGKQFRQSITQQLLATFTELGSAKKSKKIERSIRKASKALASGLKAVQKKGLPGKKTRTSRKTRSSIRPGAVKSNGKETVV